nr:integrase, catalytic region, zinc finger, CCHC-type, peptidase aspartic, catalytic [Tanacetum cinerariifolium]
MTESPLMDSGFGVPVFSPIDDLIACLNKAIDLLTTVASSRVTVQQVQGRQGQSNSSTGYKTNATSSGGNNKSGHARVVKCYNCEAEAQEAGQILDKEQLAFLADPGVPDAVLVGNISCYGSDVILAVPHSETYLNNMENQSVLAMQDFKQPPAVDFTDNEIHILEEESRSRMPKKEKDPEAIKQSISHKPIDYEKLNRLTEDFGKRFAPKQELSAEQAFWLRMSDLTSKPSDALPVKIEVPKELPKISLVNESRKKLKFHLAKFDSVSLVDKQCLEIAKKELLLEIDRLLQQIMSQDVLLTVMNSMSLLGMFKLDLELLAPKLLQNREAHVDYLKYTQEQADILQGIVKQAKAKKPLDNLLDFTYKHAQRIQELLVYVRDTCPNAIKPSAKKVAVTPKNKVKKVRFAKPLTSSSNIKQIESSTTSDSNTPVLSPTRLKCSTSNYGSKPTCNKKNDRISKHQSQLNANSELICATCCLDCTLVSGLRMFKTHNREPLSAHELLKNFKQARTKPSWIDAMQEEIHEFKRLQFWELVSCPDKVFLIKMKWIYKVKTDEFNGVLKNKATLIAQGFRQEEGIDFK